MSKAQLFSKKLVDLVKSFKGFYSKTQVIEALADILVEECKVSRHMALVIATKAYSEA